MTTAEVRDLISSSEKAAWFNSIEEEFKFPYLNFQKKFVGLSAIHEFVKQQVEGWGKIDSNIPYELRSSLEYFEEVEIKVIQTINDEESTRMYNPDVLINRLHAAVINTRSNPFLYDAPETRFLLDIAKKHPKSFEAAYNFITNSLDLNAWSNRESVIGNLLAYEFAVRSNSQKQPASELEKGSIDSIRNNFKEYINSGEKQFLDILSSLKSKSAEYSKGIDNLKSEKEESFNNWFKKTQEESSSFNSSSNQMILDLQRTYEEQLRLKAPADYWNKRAKKLSMQGWRSLSVLVILVLLGSSSLYFLLWKSPDEMLKSVFSGDTGRAVRWSIIFIAFISFLAFLIRALTKIIFSSFHLARDAEEREQLTYVYLSLIKESKMEKEDRLLILQSLFSRADTGLLKDDSSPTMPGASSILDLMRK